MPATVWQILKQTQILSKHGLPETKNDPSPSKIRNNDEHKLILKKIMWNWLILLMSAAVWQLFENTQIFILKQI
jgi:hypothetical protein